MSIRVSCLQLNPRNCVSENLQAAFRMMEDAVALGTDILVLPEMFTFMGDENQRKGETAHAMGEGVFFQLQRFAAKFEVFLVGGSHREKTCAEDGKFYNTSLAIDKTGKVVSAYRKVHLFNLKDSFGVPVYRESSCFRAGRHLPETYKIEVKNERWQAKTIICYDLRFPEISRTAKDKDCPFDILFVPAAFTWETGRDHWEILLRARAIENQCYVVACNQTGTHSDGAKRNYGHSMVIDPWGQVVASLTEECGLLHACLDKEQIKRVRLKLPALANKRIVGSSWKKQKKKKI